MKSALRHFYLQVLLGGAQLVLLAIGVALASREGWLISWSLIAAISLAAWIGVYRRLRVVDDTPTSNIATAAQGYVELSGRCESTPGMIWHLYSTVFNPEVYPMNPSWLTGKMPEDMYRREHPEHIDQAISETDDDDLISSPGESRD